MYLFACTLLLLPMLLLFGGKTFERYTLKVCLLLAVLLFCPLSVEAQLFRPRQVVNVNVNQINAVPANVVVQQQVIRRQGLLQRGVLGRQNVQVAALSAHNVQFLRTARLNTFAYSYGAVAANITAYTPYNVQAIRVVSVSAYPQQVVQPYCAPQQVVQPYCAPAVAQPYAAPLIAQTVQPPQAVQLPAPEPIKEVLKQPEQLPAPVPAPMPVQLPAPVQVQAYCAPVMAQPIVQYVQAPVCVQAVQAVQYVQAPLYASSITAVQYRSAAIIRAPRPLFIQAGCH